MPQATPPQEKLSNAVDKLLLKVITKGREVVTKKGEVVTVQATAADINAAINRLKQCGVGQVPTADNAIGQLQQNLEAAGLKFTGDGGSVPPLDDETDDAATA